MFEWANNFYTHDVLDKEFQNCKFTIDKTFPCE